MITSKIMPSNYNTIERIKKSFFESVSTTSCNGVPHLFKTNRTLLRIIWFVFISISAGASVWFIRNSVFDFLRYDVITKLETITENELIFPAVTICETENNYQAAYFYSCRFNNQEFNCLDLYYRSIYVNRNCRKFNG